MKMDWVATAAQLYVSFDANNDRHTEAGHLVESITGVLAHLRMNGKLTPRLRLERCGRGHGFQRRRRGWRARCCWFPAAVRGLPCPHGRELSCVAPWAVSPGATATICPAMPRAGRRRGRLG